MLSGRDCRGRGLCASRWHALRRGPCGAASVWGCLWPACFSLVLTLVVAGPLLGPGYLLLRDGVSTPRSYPTDSALGLGDAAPRAVPQDWLLATVSTVVDGGIVVKAILVAALWAAGWGAAVLARRLLGVSTGPQLVAATLAVWNPYVAERLLQGHWSLLAGYAALPWTVLAAWHIRLGTGARVRAWLVLGGGLAAAGLTPTGALLAGCAALVVVGRRNLVGTLGLWCVASAPWLVASALSGAGAEPSDPGGITAFAARAEPGLGTLGSLAGLGGIWNAQAVPGSRTTLFALVGTVVLLLIVACGIRGVAAHDAADSRYPRRALLILAAVAIILPALGATGWGLHIGQFLVTRIPGAGLLRDTQKYVALAMPAFALCAAAGCRALATMINSVYAETADEPVNPLPENSSGEDRNSRPISDDTARCRSDRADTAKSAENRRYSGTTEFSETTDHAFSATSTDVPENISDGTPEHEADTSETSSAARDPEETARHSSTTDGPGANGPTAATTLSSTPHCVEAEPTATGLDDTAHFVTAEPTTTDVGGTAYFVAAEPPATNLSGTGHLIAAEAEPTPPGDSGATNSTGLVAALFIALLIVVLPDLAWGVGGAMRAVHYPAGWQQVAQRMDEPGDVAVLPGGMFREFPYSGRVPVLDPAPRMVPHDVLQTGELPVSGATVAGEGTRAGVVEQLLLSGAAPAELAAHGVGWVLVEHTSPGPLGAAERTLRQLTTVYSDHDLSLYRVPAPRDVSAKSPGLYRTIAIIAHLVWVLLLVGGVAAAVYGPIRRPERAARPDR